MSELGNNIGKLVYLNYLDLFLDKNKIVYRTFKDDNELVGTAGIQPRDTLNFDACQSDWCWVPASGKSRFQIATLKELGQPAYDIVSDSGKWHLCQIPGRGQL